MIETQEKQGSSLTRGEIRFTLNKIEADKNSRIVLAVIALMVLIQGALFLWTFDMMREAKLAVKKADALIPSLQKYTEQINQMKQGKNAAPAKPVESASKSIPGQPANSPVSYSLSFDEISKQPQPGKNLFIRKKNPDAALDKAFAVFQAEDRLGTKGKGMRVDYQFRDKNQQANWIGIEFSMPVLKLNPESELTFWIKGNSKAGYNPNVKVVFTDGQKAYSHQITNVGPFWKRMDIPLSRIQPVNYQNLKAVSLIIENESAGERNGAYHLDQFEIK